ncbi:hypothetical protein N7491_003058 [Penicillium cf. griseofulvum]|nr:hypothetical protein N7491_003058 [Penicillium cf. griseofulvum]KAJ5448703.1 hypothetical protein N7445_003524 [Penicillium cf. griseofulvum]
MEELATDGIEYMVNTIKASNTAALRAYKNGGDTLHQDKHLSCLKPLARVEPESGDISGSLKEFLTTKNWWKQASE